MKKSLWSLMAAGALGLGLAQAAETDGLDADLRMLFSKLQSMNQGYYTQAEWDAIAKQMDVIATRAEGAKAWDQLIELNRVKAMALGQMRRDPQGAIEVLRGTLDKFGAKSPAQAGRLYAMMAENHAQLGKEEEISKLIKEFEQGPYYTTEQYSFSGGQGRLQELTVTRPAAKGAASIIVTMMERARRKAVFGPGKAFPDTTCTDLLGHTFKLAELRGKVVVVDFFARGLAQTTRTRHPLATAWQLYQAKGLEIVSVNLEVGAEAADLSAFAQAQKMGWNVVGEHAALVRQLAVFGDATLFVLDRNGVIAARDISEDNLIQVIKDALGLR
jgi:peroxiredoxin